MLQFMGILVMGIFPSIYASDFWGYNASISACKKGSQWALALGLFEVMSEAEVTPDVVSPWPLDVFSVTTDWHVDV